MNWNTRIFGTTFEAYKPEGDMYNLIYKLVCDYGFYVPLHIICTDNPNFLTDLIENKQDKHRRKIIMYRYIDESTGELTYALSIYKKTGPDIYMFNIDKYDVCVNKALERYLKKVYEKGVIDRSKLKWERDKEEWIEMDKLRED